MLQSRLGGLEPADEGTDADRAVVVAEGDGLVGELGAAVGAERATGMAPGSEVGQPDGGGRAPAGSPSCSPSNPRARRTPRTSAQSTLARVASRWSRSAKPCFRRLAGGVGSGSGRWSQMVAKNPSASASGSRSAGLRVPWSMTGRSSGADGLPGRSPPGGGGAGSSSPSPGSSGSGGGGVPSPGSPSSPSPGSSSPSAGGSSPSPGSSSPSPGSSPSAGGSPSSAGGSVSAGGSSPSSPSSPGSSPGAGSSAGASSVEVTSVVVVALDRPGHDVAGARREGGAAEEERGEGEAGGEPALAPRRARAHVGRRRARRLRSRGRLCVRRLRRGRLVAPEGPERPAGEREQNERRKIAPRLLLVWHQPGAPVSRAPRPPLRRGTSFSIRSASRSAVVLGLSGAGAKAIFPRKGDLAQNPSAGGFSAGLGCPMVRGRLSQTAERSRRVARGDSGGLKSS